jgi:hypothetical protein
MGKSAGQEMNWGYRLRNMVSNEECIGMFCKPNHMTLIDTDTWIALQSDKMKMVTWYYAPVGYVTRTRKPGDPNPYNYLHQYILDYKANGKGQASVDHINQNKLDNRGINLRVASQSVQNQNRAKVSRHRNAKPLPDGVQGPLPKFCVYYKECYNKEKQLFREFFTIEGHPALGAARKMTTKSGKVSISEKLEQAKQILIELDAAALS